MTAISPVLAFDPASTLIILVLLLIAPLIIVAGFTLGWWGRNASQAGEFDVDVTGEPTAEAGSRPRHTPVTSRTIERTVGAPHELEATSSRDD